MKKDLKERLLWFIVPVSLVLLLAAGILFLGNFSEPLSGDFVTVILGISLGYILFLMWALYTLDEKTLKANPKGKGGLTIAAILVFALIVRIYMGLMISGYPTDMACWTAWSHAAEGSGLFKIYSSTSFLDYPPGYIYILHIIGSTGRLLGIEYGTDVYNLMLKIPSIIADLVMAFILYRLCAKRLKHTMGLIIAFTYALNPLILLDSAAWGQIDAILTLAVAGYLLALYKDKIIWATILFIIGLLIKPQMLFFGPVLAVVFIQYIIKKGWGQSLKVFFISLFSGIALFALVVFPFTGDKPWYWIFEKYIGTISNYNYITLNSANIYGFFKLNWMPTEIVKIGLPLGTWGLIGLIATVLIYFVLGFINRDKKNIYMLTAVLMTGIYAFGLKMHERYLFPVMAVLLIAFIYDNRKSILSQFTILTTAIFINVAQVLAVIHIPPDDIVFRISSAAVVGVYIWMVVVCYKDVVKSYRLSKIEPEDMVDPIEPLLQE